MAYVLVQVDPATLGATDYLAEEQQAADAMMQTIVDNSEAETEAYNLAQQQADAEFYDSLPTTEAKKMKSAWPWIAAGVGVLLLIAFTSEDK